MMLVAWLLASLAQDTIDNPEFKGWESFKPGSSVTYKYSTPQGGQKVTLKSIGDTEAVVETEIIYNGKTAGKPVERKVPAKLPAADAPKDVKRGEEEIEVAGRTLKCRTVEYEKKLANGKVVMMKFWAHDDIPGKAAQYQMTNVETGNKLLVVATEWEKK